MSDHLAAFEDKFESWMGSAAYLVQDFEKCLRCAGPLQALADVGLELVDGYPRVSQDFNAIENVWKLLRDRLYETMPSTLETRGAFVIRLMTAVAWLNRDSKSRKQLITFSTNQKKRCQDALDTKPSGGRTHW